MNEIWRRLREWLHNNTPMGYPDRDDSLALMRYLFSAEMAEVAVHLTLYLVQYTMIMQEEELFFFRMH